MMESGNFHPMLSAKRALAITRGEVEANSVPECLEAWRIVHLLGLHSDLMGWQIGVLQNLVLGQVIEGGLRVIPGLPKTYSPYGALKWIEK